MKFRWRKSLLWGAVLLVSLAGLLRVRAIQSWQLQPVSKNESDFVTDWLAPEDTPFYPITTGNWRLRVIDVGSNRPNYLAKIINTRTRESDIKFLTDINAGNKITGLALSPDGNTLAWSISDDFGGSNTATSYLWQHKTAKPASFPKRLWRQCAFSPDGRSLYAWDGPSLDIIDVPGGRLRRHIALPPMPKPHLDLGSDSGTGMLASEVWQLAPQNKALVRLVTTKNTATWSYFSWETGTEKRFSVPAPYLFDISPLGLWVMQEGYTTSHHVTIWDARTGQQQWHSTSSAAPSSKWDMVRFSPDEALCAITSDKRLGLHNTRTGKLLWSCPVDATNIPLLPMCFSPDGTLIAVVVANHFAVYDAQNGLLVRWLNQPAGKIESWNFSPDSSLLYMEKQQSPADSFPLWQQRIR